jgi:hypothetical protein
MRGRACRPRGSDFALLRLSDGRGYFLSLASPRLTLASLRLYNAQTGKAKLTKRALAVAARLGVCPPPLLRVAPGGRRGGTADPPWPLPAEMRLVFGVDDLACAISVGTPGRDNKPVVQLMTGDGRVLGYAKIGRNDRTRELVRREARVLSDWAALGTGSFSVPRVLYHGQLGGCYLCVQSAPPEPVRAAGVEIGDAHRRFLGRLATRGLRWLPLTGSRFWSGILNRIERSPSASYRSLLRRAADVLHQRVGQEPAPFHFSHGDFAPWNVKLGAGRLYVFDWEYARDECPLGMDLFHFLVRSGALLKRCSAGKLLRAFTEPGRHRRLVEGHLCGMGLSPRWIEPLLLAYLIDQLSYQALETGPGAGLTAEMISLTRLLLVGE